jgi:hypothetical protein
MNDAPVFAAPLTISQIHQTRALITEQAAQLQELRTQYEQYQSLVQIFEEKVKQSEKELFESRAKVAPISRVPPEILGVILVIHVRENGGSPWLPMQVSRAWRATALLTRRVWTGILLTPRESSNLWTSRVCDGMQICTTEKQLLRVLNRAGNAPLDLQIALAPSTSEPAICWRHQSKITQQQIDLCKLLDILKNHQQTPRICSFELRTATLFTFPENSFEAFSFSEMESLKLDEIYGDIASKVVKEAAYLRRLVIPYTHAGGLKRFQGWSQVEELELMPDPSLTDGGSVDLSSLLSHTTNLEYLNLNRVAVKNVDQHLKGHELELLSLKCLRLRYSRPVGAFWPAFCPNLTHLFIETVSPLTATLALAMGDGAIALPLLIELDCSTDYCTFGFLRVFQVPALCKLVLENADGGKAISAQGFKELWPPQSRTSSVTKLSPSSIEPPVIHLRNTAINSKLLGRILAERNAMTEFCMKGRPITVHIFQALVPVHKPKGKGKKKGTWLVGCPKLKILKLDFSETKQSDEEAAAILEAARALVTGRAKAGAPLEQFSIRIYMIEPWRELVDRSSTV